MDAAKIKRTVDGLNSAQRRALREKFPGRTITAIWRDDEFVTVQFGHAQHTFFIGPRGGIRHHKVQHGGYLASA